MLFDQLPRSQREFNAWESSALPDTVARTHGPFAKNGNATLLRNADLHKVLLDYFAVLNQVEAGEPISRRQETIAGLRRRLAMEKRLRAIAEKELARARAQVWRSKQAELALQAEANSAEAKASEMIEELEAMLAQVSTERAELARALKKVSGIRRTST